MNQRVARGAGRGASPQKPAHSPEQVRLERAVRAARLEVVARAVVVRYSLGCLAMGRQMEQAGVAVDWADMAATLMPVLAQIGAPTADLLPALTTRPKTMTGEAL